MLTSIPTEQSMTRGNIEYSKIETDYSMKSNLRNEQTRENKRTKSMFVKPNKSSNKVISVPTIFTGKTSPRPETPKRSLSRTSMKTTSLSSRIQSSGASSQMKMVPLEMDSNSFLGRNPIGSQDNPRGMAHENAQPDLLKLMIHKDPETDYFGMSEKLRNMLEKSELQKGMVRRSIQLEKMKLFSKIEDLEERIKISQSKRRRVKAEENSYTYVTNDSNTDIQVNKIQISKNVSGEEVSHLSEHEIPQNNDISRISSPKAILTSEDYYKNQSHLLHTEHKEEVDTKEKVKENEISNSNATFLYKENERADSFSSSTQRAALPSSYTIPNRQVGSEKSSQPKPELKSTSFCSSEPSKDVPPNKKQTGSPKHSPIRSKTGVVRKEDVYARRISSPGRDREDPAKKVLPYYEFSGGQEAGLVRSWDVGDKPWRQESRRKLEIDALLASPKSKTADKDGQLECRLSESIPETSPLGQPDRSLKEERISERLEAPTYLEDKKHENLTGTKREDSEASFNDEFPPRQQPSSPAERLENVEKQQKTSTLKRQDIPTHKEVVEDEDEDEYFAEEDDTIGSLGGIFDSKEEKNPSTEKLVASLESKIVPNEDTTKSPLQRSAKESLFYSPTPTSENNIEKQKDDLIGTLNCVFEESPFASPRKSSTKTKIRLPLIRDDDGSVESPYQDPTDFHSSVMTDLTSEREASLRKYAELNKDEKPFVDKTQSFPVSSRPKAETVIANENSVKSGTREVNEEPSDIISNISVILDGLSNNKNSALAHGKMTNFLTRAFSFRKAPPVVTQEPEPESDRDPDPDPDESSNVSMYTSATAIKDEMKKNNGEAGSVDEEDHGSTTEQNIDFEIQPEIAAFKAGKKVATEDHHLSDSSTGNDEDVNVDKEKISAKAKAIHDADQRNETKINPPGKDLAGLVAGMLAVNKIAPGAIDYSDSSMDSEIISAEKKKVVLTGGKASRMEPEKDNDKHPPKKDLAGLMAGMFAVNKMAPGALDDDSDSSSDREKLVSMKKEKILESKTSNANSTEPPKDIETSPRIRDVDDIMAGMLALNKVAPETLDDSESSREADKLVNMEKEKLLGLMSGIIGVKKMTPGLATSDSSENSEEGWGRQKDLKMKPTKNDAPKQDMGRPMAGIVAVNKMSNSLLQDASELSFEREDEIPKAQETKKKKGKLGRIFGWVHRKKKPTSSNETTRRVETRPRLELAASFESTTLEI